MAIIETERLTKYYGSCRGVEDLSLRVEEGEVFGYLGPNGAGKTTTIRLLLGLIRPSWGCFRICDADVDYRSSSFRKHIGYLPGEVGFWGHLTGCQFLSRLASLRSTRTDAEVRSLARRLELDLSRKIKGLSHGTRQKLAIVQALMHNARILILDEPTSGLDPLVRQVFYELVREEKERGTTIFLSSHVLTEVERTCSRVGIVRDGRLVAVEGIDNLKRKHVKRVEVEFGREVNPQDFCLPGVRSLQVDGSKIAFSIEGEYCGILRALAAHPIENITIRDATLEDIFLEYYSGPAEGDR